jgi:hypothetical protein
MYVMGFLRLIIILLALTGSTVRFEWRPREEVDPENLESWFMEDQEYFHWIDVPSGAYKPNTTVSIRFKNRIKGTIYYRLIRIHGEPEIIFEETRIVTVEDKDAFTWKVQLPEDAPAFYRIGAMFLSGKSEKMDHVTGWVQTIIVPEQKLNAYMFLDKEEYDRFDDIILTIVNNGTSEITYGVGYRYQKYVDGEWTGVPRNGVEILILPLHPPMTNSSETLDHPNFSGGRYRVCKEVERAGTDIKGVLKAEFTIKSAPARARGSPIWMIIGAFVMIFGISLILIKKYRLNGKNGRAATIKKFNNRRLFKMEFSPCFGLIHHLKTNDSLI